MVYITDRLAVGSFPEACAAPDEIGALLCVAAERDLGHVDRLYCKVPLPDMQPIDPKPLADALTFLSGALPVHRVLLFCNAGVGRSPSVCVAYLCCECGLGFGQAVETVARRKPFMSILPDLLKSIEAVRELRCPGVPVS